MWFLTWLFAVDFVKSRYLPTPQHIEPSVLECAFFFFSTQEGLLYPVHYIIIFSLQKTELVVFTTHHASYHKQSQ